MNGVIYARYSSSGQREESIEGQLRDCHSFAKRCGITVVGEYCDRATTGTNDRRPEFQRMIRDSSRGQFQVIITWKNDRFARSRYDAAIYKYRLKQNGVRIMYAKESIPDGPEGIIFESMMEGFAEYYSANLSQNVKRGNYDSALKRQTLGHEMLGYKTGSDKRYEIDPQTAPIVQRIFREYAAGRSAVDIFTDLNNEGFKTFKGNPFNKNSLRRILKNEKYKGVYRYMDIYDEHGVPALVDVDTWDKAQKMLEKHHHSPASKRVEGGFLLTSKLFCGECGALMTGDSGTGRRGTIYYYYTCVNRRGGKCHKERAKKDWIEDIIVSELARIVESDEVINALADRFMEWQADHAEDSALKELEKRLKKTESAIANTMKAIDSGIITDSVKTHLMELEAEKAALLKSIAKERIKEPELSRDAVVWFLESFRDGDQSDAGWRMYLVDTFLRAAYLYDDGRMILDLNYGANGRISLEIAEKAVRDGIPLCSDFAHTAGPHGANSNIYFYCGILAALVFAHK